MAGVEEIVATDFVQFHQIHAAHARNGIAKRVKIGGRIVGDGGEAANKAALVGRHVQDGAVPRQGKQITLNEIVHQPLAR
jgi:hypothetical protein